MLSILVDGSSAPELSSDLRSLVVHVVESRATAEVEVIGVPDERCPTMELGRTTLEVQDPGGVNLFTGHIAEYEVTLVQGQGPALVILAEGGAPEGGTDPTPSLRFGAEIESGSVRRTADGLTARCMTAAAGLGHGSRVHLTTPTPNFDGDYEVMELWHRWDAVHGRRTEFVAVR